MHHPNRQVLREAIYLRASFPVTNAFRLAFYPPSKIPSAQRKNMIRKWWHSIAKQAKFVFEVIAGEEVRTQFLQAIPFWVASILTGLIAVAYTRMFTFSEELLQDALGRQRWYIFIITPTCLLTAWFIVKLAPMARGSGIPQVMAAIEVSASSKTEKKIDLLLNFKIICVKIVSSLFMVFGGAAIGREGPTIQIAGSVFRLVNKWTPKSWPKLSQMSFILTGAAAGLAAAFNTPLGGIVFAIEELAKIHISFLRTALFTAVIIAGLTAQGMLGPYLYLGYPDVKNLPVFVYAGVLVAAIIAGMIGGLTGKLIIKIMRWKRNFSQAQTIVFILLTGLAIASVAFFFNDHVLGSGKELMNGVLFSNIKDTTWDTLVVRLFGTIMSFNIGASGGVFAPSLSAGAAVGAFLSHLFHVTGGNANILILSGMVGFLTGVTRTPFTSAILVLEMTDRHSVIFHLMLAALTSNIAAFLIDKRSLYEQLKQEYMEELTGGEGEVDKVVG